MMAIDAIRSRGWLVVMSLALACGGTQRIEVPLCSAPELRPEPAEDCRERADFAPYRDELARTLARQMHNQIPAPLSISVELDPKSRVERVCAAPEAASLPWNLRMWITNSLGSLRAIPPGPDCVAARRIELSDALFAVTAVSPQPEESALELGSCLGLRDKICIEQNAPVCGVFPDGTRRTFGNACKACETGNLKGWSEGACGLR